MPYAAGWGHFVSCSTHGEPFVWSSFKRKKAYVSQPEMYVTSYPKIKIVHCIVLDVETLKKSI